MRDQLIGTLILCALIPAVGCVEDEGESFDVTLESDSKADELGGKRVVVNVASYDTSWFDDTKTQSSVTVRMRADDKLSLEGVPVVFHPNTYHGKCTADAQCPGGMTCESNVCVTHHYDYGDILSIRLQATRADVELGFLLIDVMQTALTDNLAIASCGGSNIFRRVDIDYSTREITRDGVQTFSFAQCGIATDRDVFFKTFAVPLRTPAGQDFDGTYTYKPVTEVN